MPGLRSGASTLRGIWAWLTAVYLAIGAWFSDHVVVPATAVSEEFTKSVARGCIISFQRWINTCSSLLLSLFPGAKKEARTRARAHTEAWRAWLKGATGTFNALLEQEGLMPGGSGGSLQPSTGDTAGDTYTVARGARRRWIRRWLRRGPDAEPAHATSSAAVATSTYHDSPGDVSLPEQPATRPETRHPGSYLAPGTTPFDLPSGFAVASMIPRRGFLDDLWVQTEAGLGKIFAFLRSMQRKLLAPNFLSATRGGPSILRRDSGSGGLFSPVPTGTFLTKWEDAHVWTASDFVLRAGYPLEEHSVVTADGYVLAVHRIPRSGPAKGVVLFVHGVLDTSLGWVANGSVGSQAFAAYDAGFDVWLGNARSNAPRINVRPDHQGLRYWRYSANEQAMLDLAAQIEHIHAVKMAEARKRDDAAAGQTHLEEEKLDEHSSDEGNLKDTVASSSSSPPYRLQAVGHSLGAGCLLMYATMCCMEGRPHRLSRLILMSPAGFHSHVPKTVRFCKYLFPWCAALMDKFLPGRGIGLRLPSPFLRYVTFKLSLDVSSLPALQTLVRRLMQAMFSGDVSEWDLAMQMPHYNTTSMPAVSLHTGAHFAQWSRDGAFRLYDYGAPERNLEAYGTPRPPSIAENYRLLDIPVDLVAGTSDRIVSPHDVKTHAHWLSRSGAGVTFAEFRVGHMDLTFAVKPELRDYVLRRLQRPLPPHADKESANSRGFPFTQRCAEDVPYVHPS